MPDATLDAQQLPTATTVDRSDLRPPHIGHVIVIALIVGMFAALWLVTYDEINNAIWHSGFVAAHRWALPVGGLFF